MFLKAALFVTLLVSFLWSCSPQRTVINNLNLFKVSTSAQLLDYSTLQTTLNDLAYGAEKDLQTFRLDVSEYVLSATDEMITHATNSLSGTNDPNSPMIAACTLYPTNWISHHTKELNKQLAEAQTKVNAMKFAVLTGLVNQPMISAAEATYNQVRTQVREASERWTAIKAELEYDIDNFKYTVSQLVVDMKECIRIIL